MSEFGYSRLGAGADVGGTEKSSIQQSRSTWKVWRIPFRNLARLTVSLPLGGFVFCVFWAMYSDLDAATYTHCGVS